MRKRSNNRFQRQQKPEFRTNRAIRVPKVRLVGDNFEEISQAAGRPVESDVYHTNQVLGWAEEMGLDVVEISPNAEPPVVKIIDFNKFLYLKKKKEKEIKNKTAKTVIKEIRFGPNTDEHDFNFKLNHAKKFLTDGAKVKAYVHFRGRTIVFKDRGELLLLRFINELAEYGGAEDLPKMEGRRMIVMLSPQKKAKK